MIVTIAFALLQYAWYSNAYYLPGVSPYNYEEGESVKLFVEKLTSTKTQMPYDFYSLPFCKPKNFGLQSENLGEALSGDRIENSVYKVRLVLYPVVCNIILSNIV
jgi:transmembrane 9 superfamily protein 2/4